MPQRRPIRTGRGGRPMQDRLKSLRDQMTSDFEVTWKILGCTANQVEEQTLRIEALAREMAALNGRTAEGLRQAEGRMRLVEQRFGIFLDAIQGDLQQRATQEDLDDLRARVERLEQRIA